MSAKTTDKPNGESKVEKSVVTCKSFYNKHFPTDKKTFNLRLPFSGLILSLVAADFITTFICNYYFDERHSDLAKYAYMLAAFGVSYELYYGLKIGDRKQYTPWIIFKIIEIILIFVGIIIGFAVYSHRLYHFAGSLTYGFIIFFIDLIVTLVVFKKSMNEYYGPRNENADDNIYDTYYEDA